VGFAPPEDAAPPEAQDAASASAGFSPSPSGPEICGFAVPTFSFNLSFNLPLPSFALPPQFFFALSLKCDLSDPIDADAGFGGGRVGRDDLEKDPEE